MHVAFLSEVERSQPFRVEALPWILRVYSHPIDRWRSPGRQALFGAPNFLLYFLYQRLWPIPAKASFIYRRCGRDYRISYNTKNSQFIALYCKAFAQGYEPQTTSLINLLLPTEGVFYDVGSNWGWFSLSVLASSGFRGRVHAFEPFRSSYRDLCSVVKQAGLEDRISCHSVALGDHCAEGTMRLPDHFQSGLAVVEECGTSGGAITKIVTLDSLGLERPDVIKVDVEGFEAKVFNGSREVLKKHCPMIVFENSRPHDDPSKALVPMTILKELGYILYRLAWRRNHEGTEYFTADEPEVCSGPKETLTLVRFDISERLLLPESINIFACHESKTNELAKRFEAVKTNVQYGCTR